MEHSCIIDRVLPEIALDTFADFYIHSCVAPIDYPFLVAHSHEQANSVFILSAHTKLHVHALHARSARFSHTTSGIIGRRRCFCDVRCLEFLARSSSADAIAIPIVALAHYDRVADTRF